VNSQKDSEPAGEQMTLFSQAGSRNYVSPLALQANAKAQRMPAIYGPRCLEQFEKLPQPGLWAKMFSGLLIGMPDWYSSRCKLTWRLRGTKYRRTYFQLAVQAHPTAGIEYGLLLTPTTCETAQDLVQFKNRMAKYPNGTTMPNLATQVMGLLPTPQATDFKGGATAESYEARGRGENNDLRTWAAFHERTGKTSQLNPRFVAEMMGFPPNWLELPFQNTETKV